MRSLAIVLLAFISAAVARAADMNPTEMPRYGQWRSSMIGGGGYVQNVVCCPSDPARLYTYVDVGGFYRSDDGGKHWRMMHGNLPNREGKTEVRGLVVDPRDGDSIAVACGSQWANEPLGVFISSDGGKTLTQTLKARFGGNADFRWDGFVLSRDPANSDVLLAASLADGIFRSVDNGKTWSAAAPDTTGFFFTDLRLDRADGKRGWACALAWKGWLGGKDAALKSAFFLTEDGGVTWRKLTDESPREIVQDPKSSRLYGIFGNGGEIRCSDDGGKNWRDLGTGLPIDLAKANVGMTNAHPFNAITTGPDFVVLANTVGDFFRLKSGSDRWQPIPRKGINYRGWFGGHRPDGYSMFGQALGSITVDPRNPDHWFFTDWFAIYETLDAGSNWTLQMDGVEVTVIHCITQDPSDPGRVYLGMADNGYFLSLDGGVSFDQYKMAGNNKDIALSPELPARVYGTATATWEWEANQVYVSIDGGATWQRSPMTGLPDMKTARCNTIAANPNDRYEVFIGVSGDVAPGKGGPYRSTDGGKSWTWIGDRLPRDAGFYPDSIWNPGPQIAAGPGGQIATISRSAVYAFDHNSSTWKPVVGEVGGAISIVADPFVAGRFLVTADTGIYSVNNGKSQRIYTTRATHIAADVAKPNRFAAAVHDGIVLSTDGGKTWTMLDTALPHALATNPLAFAGERLIVGSGGSGAFWIPLSPDGERPVKANPVVAAILPAASGPLPALKNLDFTAGGETPNGWNAPWIGEGELSVHLDRADRYKGKVSMRLQTDAANSYGSVGQSFAPVVGTFVISGAGKSSGEIKEALVAIQVYDTQGKQIAWLQIANLAEQREWKTFAADVQIPPGADHCNLVVTLRGNGSVSVADMKVQHASNVFR